MKPEHLIYLVIPVLVKFLIGGIEIGGQLMPYVSGLDFGAVIAALGGIHSASKWVDNQNK